MNWQDRLQTKLTIQTGDGKIYTPLWNEAEINVNFNVEGFDFVGLEGTYVERKEKSGSQYPLNFYFQGEDCIDTAMSFEVSARNKSVWKVQHPFYGSITCQPLGLKIDNNSYNISKVSVTIWETLETKYPQPKANIKGSSIELRDKIQLTALTPIVGISTLNSSEINISLDVIKKNYENIATTDAEKLNLKNLYRDALSGANGIINDFNSYLVKTQALINFPLTALQTTEFKLNRSIDLLSELADIFVGNEASRELFDKHATALISNISACVVNPVNNDYTKRSQVATAISRLSQIYNDYIEILELIEFDADPQISFDLDLIVNTSLSELYDIAFDSKQEREITLNYDSNVVVLAKKYFGAGDENLNAFIDLNDFKINELLQVRKGRTIKWLV